MSKIKKAARAAERTLEARDRLADSLTDLAKATCEHGPSADDVSGRVALSKASRTAQMTYLAMMSPAAAHAAEHGVGGPVADGFELITTRAEAIRKADPSVSEAEALSRVMSREAQAAYLASVRGVAA